MAQINREQVEKVAAFLKANPPKTNGLNFYSFTGKDGKEIVASDMYPEIGHPQALNFFFYGVSQDFGFWVGNDSGYESPIYGDISGKKKVKGSDLLWQMFKRAFDKDPEYFIPEKLAVISDAEFARLFSDDNGPYPFPDRHTRLMLTRKFGTWFITNNVSAKNIVDESNTDPAAVLPRFKFYLNDIPGYSGDWAQKKILLLAMVLANRPEKFLRVGANEDWPTIIDYHLMRLAERMGLVDLDAGERSNSENRVFVPQEEEQVIRSETWKAVDSLTHQSGLPMSVIDETLWMARKYCPEMTEPECGKCMFNSVCKKRTKLFQPVFRTTNY